MWTGGVRAWWPRVLLSSCIMTYRATTCLNLVTRGWWGQDPWLAVWLWGWPAVPWTSFFCDVWGRLETWDRKQKVPLVKGLLTEAWAGMEKHDGQLEILGRGWKRWGEGTAEPAGLDTARVEPGEEIGALIPPLCMFLGLSIGWTHQEARWQGGP
jgi:hypothetical protein